MMSSLVGLNKLDFSKTDDLDFTTETCTSSVYQVFLQFQVLFRARYSKISKLNSNFHLEPLETYSSLD